MKIAGLETRWVVLYHIGGLKVALYGGVMRGNYLTVLIPRHFHQLPYISG